MIFLLSSLENLPPGHFHNLSLAHLDKDFLMFLDDISPACFLSLLDDSIFDLDEEREKERCVLFS